LADQPDRYTVVFDQLQLPPSIRRALSFLEPVGPDIWFDENIDEVISNHELVLRYGDLLPPSLRKIAEHPPWLSKIIDSTECRLIETQRLLRISRHEDNYRSNRRPPVFPRAVVQVEARDLAARIERTLGDYANRAQSLDQTFPKRLIQALYSNTAPEAASVTKRLLKVEKKRSALIEVGLLDQSGAPEILSQAELQATHVRQVIGVYLDDMEQKLSRFDQLFKRVSLFKEIITEKFQFKSVFVSRGK
jgi:hypothetical protein